MTDERDSLELAWRGPASDDLPLPPPLRISGETALFLDFDGTLVEIAARPDLVKVARALPALLEGLGEKLGGRLAIISGRALEAVDHLLGPINVAMAGSHGGEFRPAAGSEIHPLADPLPESIAAPFARFASDNGELLAERKPFSMAVHYRGRPEMHEPLLAMARDLASQHHAAVKDGKMVVEVVMPGSDKGSAISRFMEMPLFAGTTPCFVGDDVTDEDGMRAALAVGGEAVKVGPGDSVARYRLGAPGDLARWLARQSEADGKSAWGV